MEFDLKHKLPPFLRRKIARLKSEVKNTLILVNLNKNRRDRRIIDRAIGEYRGKDIFLFPFTVEWNIPLFQRPQQIAMAMSEIGQMFVYFTCGVLDKVDEPLMLREHCMLIHNRRIRPVMDIARKHNKRIIIDVYSTNNSISIKQILRYQEMGCTILYEYIDEISEEISGRKIPRKTYEKHNALLKDRNVYVVATATNLYEEAIRIRGCNDRILCSGNGVDVKHFFHDCNKNVLLPEMAAKAVQDNRPIVGYFGAIAKWFDFGLILAAAEMRPEYLFLIIGPLYSNGLKQVDELKARSNIVLTGSIDYDELPAAASQFTVATIPFAINEITESTSPIKLFEYFALGKPVVTTAMKECYKYPDVMIANTADEYVSLLDKAVSIANGAGYIDYALHLRKVADDNSWQHKATEIMELVSR